MRQKETGREAQTPMRHSLRSARNSRFDVLHVLGVALILSYVGSGTTSNCGVAGRSSTASRVIGFRNPNSSASLVGNCRMMCPQEFSEKPFIRISHREFEVLVETSPGGLRDLA